MFEDSNIFRDNSFASVEREPVNYEGRLVLSKDSAICSGRVTIIPGTNEHNEHRLAMPSSRKYTNFAPFKKLTLFADYLGDINRFEKFKSRLAAKYIQWERQQFSLLLHKKLLVNKQSRERFLDSSVEIDSVMTIGRVGSIKHSLNCREDLGCRLNCTLCRLNCTLDLYRDLERYLKNRISFQLGFSSELLLYD